MTLYQGIKMAQACGLSCVLLDQSSMKAVGQFQVIVKAYWDRQLARSI
jgi:hypothetical protein